MAEQGLKGLKVYQMAYQLAMDCFHLSKKFPPEEKFGLTSQVRNSSRSVCSNMAEGYRRRKYPAHFVSKITDADSENTETRVWLDFAVDCGYVKKDETELLEAKSIEVGKILDHMIQHPDKFNRH